MKKRILIYALVTLLLLSHVTPLISAASSNVEEKYITVDSRGTFYSQRVYEDSDGTIFVPISMLTQFGAMRCSEGTSQYTFYYNNETAVSAGSKTPVPGARRIFIDKSGKSGSVVCYTSRTNYSTIESIKFSDSHTINGKLYLPLAEFLPLFDAKVEITTDGVLHIYRNPVPLYSALLSHNLDLWYFDSDKLVGDDFIKASGLIVDSILGLKFNRLDFITNSGAIKDYSSLFKKLLTDNETYLSAFDKTETPIDKALSLTSDSAGELDDFVGGVKNVLNGAKYVFSEHKTYKEFSDTIKEEFNADVVEGAIKVVEFADAYISQVDDHRNMLDAVYGGGSNPAAIAANEVYTLYGKQTASQITSAATSALRDYITGELSSAVTKELGLTPYKIAFSAVKLVLPEAVKEFSNGAQLFYLDKVIEDAYTVTNKRLDNIKFDEASLEDLRLSLIMTLVASKFGYETYISDDAEEVGQINEWLEELYLAADSVECVSKGYYAEKKAELAKSCSYIKPETPASSGGSSSGGSSSSGGGSSSGSSSSGTTEHKHTYTTKKTEATCESKGYTTYTCRCGETYKDDYVNALGHNYVDGVCSRCGKVDNSSSSGGSSTGIVDSGECGDNLTWTLDEDGVLTISGTGKMWDYWDDTLPWYNYELEIIKVVIEEGVTSIGDCAFYMWYTNLSSITIGDSVTSIGAETFRGCKSLTSITISDSVTSIGDSAFRGCDSLTSFTIPDSVTSIGEYAFYECDGLIGIWTNENNGYYSSDEYGVLFNKDKTALIQAPVAGKFTQYTIPDGVTSIGCGAFAYCDLASITIPDSVASIGDYAFYACDNFSSITIPDSVTSIGEGAFYYCKSLTSITIPDSVTSIGDYAFYACDNLTSITIPDSVTSIDKGAFSACDNLTDVYYSGSESDWSMIDIHYYNDSLLNAAIHYNS